MNIKYITGSTPVPLKKFDDANFESNFSTQYAQSEA